MARNYPEESLQIACVQWFRLQYPNSIIFHVPNGGKRNPREAARLKRAGTLAGIPDLFVAEPCNNMSGLFIEMKSPKGKLTDSQKDMSDRLLNFGYAFEVCRSIEGFVSIVREYING